MKQFGIVLILFSALVVGCSASVSEGDQFFDDSPGVQLEDPCDPNPCTVPNRSVCAEMDEGITCLCDPGFVEDVDGFCAVPDYINHTPCDPNPCTLTNRTQCLNMEGTAFCVCDPGYGEDATGACVDPCTGIDCGLNGTCIVADGEAMCDCDEGYMDVELNCEALPDPTVCEPNPCMVEHKTICQSIDNAAVCFCDPGYEDDSWGECVKIQP